MKRERFPLTSDQLELLLSFETCEGLNHLAEVIAKDPSVVSRNLQRLGADLPVITKHSGKWRMTELGRQVNQLTREYLKTLESRLPSGLSNPDKSADKPCFCHDALLVVINAQNGLHDPVQGHRNNSGAENNIQRLLEYWRANKRPVVHVKHVSDDASSLFYRLSGGVSFIPALSPNKDETVIEKSKSSAFSGTILQELVTHSNFSALVLTGFTAGECIDATARQSSDLGFTTYVVSDATATFDIVGPDGALHKAERVHNLLLANLHNFFAEIVDTNYLLRL